MLCWGELYAYNETYRATFSEWHSTTTRQQEDHGQVRQGLELASAQIDVEVVGLQLADAQIKVEVAAMPGTNSMHVDTHVP